MKQLFRKTLLAAAVAGFSTAAIAGDMIVTPAVYSEQGVVALGAGIVTAPVADYVLRAGYSIDALIEIQLTVGALNDSGDWPATLTAPVGVTFAGAVFNLVSPGTDSALYQVQSIDPATNGLGGSTIGATLRIEASAGVGLTLNASAVAAGNIDISATSTLSNGFTVIDATSSTGESNSAALTDTADQFGDIAVASAGMFDGVIDVAKARKEFTTATGGTSNSMTWTATDDVSLLSEVDAYTTTVNLNGNFTGMTDANFRSMNGGAVALSANADMVTVTYTKTSITPVVTTDTITVTNDSVVMVAQEFTVDGEREYGATPVVESIGSADAGEWTLNGAMVNIPYMPYGDTVSQIIYVTNEGDQVGDILVTAFDQLGNPYDLNMMGLQAGKTAVTKITGEVKAALTAAGFVPVSGNNKVSLTITVNAPASDITVYASYNVGGTDRGFVNTSEYKGIKN